MYAGGRNTLPDCEAGISKSVNGEEADIQEKAGIQWDREGSRRTITAGPEDCDGGG